MVWVHKLRSKTAKEVPQGINDIFTSAGTFPKKFQSDHGKEFINSLAQQYYKEKGITWFATQNQEIKCSHVERFHQTLERRLHLYFTHSRTRRWIDVVQNLVDSYNHTPHRSLGFEMPASVSTDNADTFRELPKLKQLFKRLPSMRIKVGDFVRIALKKSAMEKGAYQSFSNEVYKVSEKLDVQKSVLYRVKDLLGDEVKRRFYPFELQVVPGYTTESAPAHVLRRKGNKVLVHYEGWDKKFDEWINKKELQEK